MAQFTSTVSTGSNNYPLGGTFEMPEPKKNTKPSQPNKNQHDISSKTETKISKEHLTQPHSILHITKPRIKTPLSSCFPHQTRFMRPGRYRFDIYRLGWYRGLGARRLATLRPSAKLPQEQPECYKEKPRGLRMFAMFVWNYCL